MYRRPAYQTSRRQSGSLSGLVGALFFVVVWQVLASLVNQKVLLPGPLDVLRALGNLLSQSKFWLSVGGSVLTITGGFLLGFALAVLLAFLAYFFPVTEPFFCPIISIVKSAPVAALTIILMIWIDPDILPFVLVLMAIVPPLYGSALAGLRDTSEELLEMAFVFRFRTGDRFRAIYLPSLIRQLQPSLEYTSGLAWKAGITGEIMAQPFGRLGTGLYDAKIQLESAEVLAYLAVILFFSFVLTQVVGVLSKHPLQVSRKPHRSVRLSSVSKKPDIQLEVGSADPAISVKNLAKSYGQQTVLQDFSCEISQGQTVVVTGSSGEGKTTFFRLLTGLAEPDQGQIGFAVEPRFSYAFQDVRLLDDFTLSENLLFAGGRFVDDEVSFLAYWESLITSLGLPLGKPIREYSGGMKQKASLIRALAIPANIVILDEVFREVDAQAEAQMLQLFQREKGSRTILIATHRRDLADGLSDTAIFIANS